MSLKEIRADLARCLKSAKLEKELREADLLSFCREDDRGIVGCIQTEAGQIWILTETRLIRWKKGGWLSAEVLDFLELEDIVGVNCPFFGGPEYLTRTGSRLEIPPYRKWAGGGSFESRLTVFGDPAAFSMDAALTHFCMVACVRKVISPALEQHGETLARRRRQLLTIDHYGASERSAWEGEMRLFWQRVCQPLVLRSKWGWPGSVSAEDVFPLIDAAADEDAAQARSTHRDQESEQHPQEFEESCADILRAAGWSARRVGGTGDQGVDVIAERSGVRLAVQCKRYAKPVGNKAVQEVLAAAAFEDAHQCVVVTTSSYTISARQLATKTGVSLLHVSELAAFAAPSATAGPTPTSSRTKNANSKRGTTGTSKRPKS